MFQILRKICHDEQDCLGTVLSCFEPSALCSSSKKCNSDCQHFHKKSQQYQLIKTFDLAITDGPFYLKSFSSFKLLSDDLIAFRMRDAQLAYRQYRPGEEPDFKFQMTDDQATVFDSTKFKRIDDRKYLIRLIVSEPLTFTMPHVYSQSGRYPIKFEFSNEFDQNDLITRTNFVSVQSIISKMRLTVKPPNTAVAKKVDIVVQLSKGSNIQLEWDFGDGNQTSEHIPCE